MRRGTNLQTENDEDMDMIEQVTEAADTIERNERITLAWAKRGTKSAFRAALDDEMRRRGWEVPVPGRYRRPR